jgi:predicted ATPase
LESKSRQKRIRIFAGPNGSGKSTLYEKIRTEYKIRFGYYINADKIFEELRGRGCVDLSVFQIKTTPTEFAGYYLKSGWDTYIAEKDIWISGKSAKASFPSKINWRRLPAPLS